MAHHASQSAQALAYHHLLEEIRSGRMPGGTHIVAEAAAQALGISRIPVREAIRQLASEGFVQLRSNRGATVTMLGAEQIEELSEIRAALEGLAMARAATRMKPEDFAEAELALQRLDAARGDPDWFVRAHDQFHEVFLVACGRPRLVAEIRRYRTYFEPYLRMNIRRSANALNNTLAEHASLLAAVRNGDPQLIDSEMRAHVMRMDVRDMLRSG
jgi:DNA-binding GntR family transcriptional regulator